MAGTHTWADATGVVELPDGRRVRGRGLRRPLPDDAEPAEFGLYVVGRRPDATPWPSQWLRWPDLGLPLRSDEALGAIRDAHDRAAHERVEVACAGGNGRTGTVLAVMAVLSGVPRADAVAWVRANYRARAIETPWQRWWIGAVTR